MNRVQTSFAKSLSGDSVYEDPLTEISMCERIPDPVDFFSCTNNFLLKDWETHSSRYSAQSVDTQTSLVMDIRVNN